MKINLWKYLFFIREKKEKNLDLKLDKKNASHWNSLETTEDDAENGDEPVLNEIHVIC